MLYMFCALLCLLGELLGILQSSAQGGACPRAPARSRRWVPAFAPVSPALLQPSSGKIPATFKVPYPCTGSDSLIPSTKLGI